jgi:ATP-dependent Clp protease ATP-binding subunit ClpC
MFDRYTESAKRALFFARYEVSALGGTSIETEHILLGLAREPEGLVGRVLTPAIREDIRRDVDSRSRPPDKVTTSIEIPFSAETQRVLQFTADEAHDLGHSYIGTEHLLLGLLREDTSAAASILRKHGLALDAVRQTIVQLLREVAATPRSEYGDVSEEVEQLKLLVERLARKVPDERLAGELVDRIKFGLDQLRTRFGR